MTRVRRADGPPWNERSTDEELTEFVTVRLDEDDVRERAILRRDHDLRDNGREATHSLVVRDLIREAIAVLRARGAPPVAATFDRAGSDR